VQRQCFDPHPAHKRANMASPNKDVLSGQLIAQHARTHEWMLQMQLIKAAHQSQVSLTDGLGQVYTDLRLTLSSLAWWTTGNSWFRSIMALRSAIPLW
jgi:hypothetical protein